MKAHKTIKAITSDELDKKLNEFFDNLDFIDVQSINYTTIPMQSKLSGQVDLMVVAYILYEVAQEMAPSNLHIVDDEGETKL